MDLFFWQNMPSHIQAPALIELSKIWNGEVHCVWARESEEHRKQLGWQPPELTGIYEHVLDGDPAIRTTGILREHRRAIHVFSGLNAYRPVTAAYKHAARLRLENLALMVEPGIAMGWKGLLRPLRARFLARGYKPHIKAVLAMGSAGVRFYRSAGFARDVLYPYMYQSFPASCAISRTVGNPVRLVYVGKFDLRKGVDILFRGLAYCSRENYRLTIVGGGKQEAQLRNLAEQLNISRKLDWAGIQPSCKVAGVLAASDLCVVPSRFEGWGVVTNEAIQSGTPVICSDTTTSRDLVSESRAGRIFKTANPRDLASVLDYFLGDPSRLETARHRAMGFRHRLSPRVVGQYLKAVLECAFGLSSKRPTAPWLVEPQESN